MACPIRAPPFRCDGRVTSECRGRGVTWGYQAASVTWVNWGGVGVGGGEERFVDGAVRCPGGGGGGGVGVWSLGCDRGVSVVLWARVVAFRGGVR